MKSSKEIITTLEHDFYCHQKEMDNYQELASNVEDKRSLRYERYQNEVIKEANIACYICEVIADILGTSVDTEMARLYKKFNLEKVNV